VRHFRFRHTLWRYDKTGARAVALNQGIPFLVRSAQKISSFYDFLSHMGQKFVYHLTGQMTKIPYYSETYQRMQ
jgi:hypothetical protein